MTDEASSSLETGAVTTLFLVMVAMVGMHVNDPHFTSRCPHCGRVELQRIEEGEQLQLLNGAQVAEAPGHVPRLAEVACDRVLQRQRSEIVHIPRSRAQTPQCGRAQLVGGILRWSLHDAVTRLDVMQQEVAERMNDLVSQRLRHDKRATVDDRPCRGRRNGLNMAGGGADPHVPG